MLKAALLTCLALTALAANSVLCRLALGDGSVDAISFTLIRLGSGIVMLLLVACWFLKRQTSSVDTSVTGPVVIASSEASANHHADSNTSSGSNSNLFALLSSKGSLKAASMLFLYAIAFSIAYLDLDTGTGALILFGAVQLTMIIVGLLSGQKLHTIEWAGVIIAFVGFIYLVLPGLTTPSLIGFILMTLAGIAWGFYTLMGRGSENPMLDTAANFMRTWPMLLVLTLWLLWQGADISTQGFMLAVTSGAITSGLGYIIWYAVLKYYSATQAAVLQLSVPVIAAFGGVLFVAEGISLNLLLSSLMILGGILLVIGGRWYLARKAARD
ncbi:MAG: EamA family transporter [Oceanospirillum sp.]|nr:EamA family transporter [Oceanospirillum sp.]